MTLPSTQTKSSPSSPRSTSSGPVPLVVTLDLHALDRPWFIRPTSPQALRPRTCPPFQPQALQDGFHKPLRRSGTGIRASAGRLRASENADRYSTGPQIGSSLLLSRCENSALTLLDFGLGTGSWVAGRTDHRSGVACSDGCPAQVQGGRSSGRVSRSTGVDAQGPFAACPTVAFVRRERLIVHPRFGRSSGR